MRVVITAARLDYDGSMRTLPIAALLLVSCGAPASTDPPPGERAPAPPREGAPVAEAAAAEPFASIGERSGCAFESLDALCEGFREHYLSASPGWVSDGCGLGEPRVSSGPFAEVREVGIRVGHEPIEGDARVERPLLGGTVREPPGREATTQVVLAARVGRAWFPIRVFHPSTDGEIPGDRVEWELDESGATLTWTDEEGASRRGDPSGYGQTERTIAAVQRGVPMIAAQATIERWRSDVDLECARACNQAPSAPPHPECDRRCASSVRATRSWARTGDTVRIGATQVQREGAHGAGASDVHLEEAETRRLDASDAWMSFCGFVPVVRAVATSALPADPESVAARERARAILQRGTWRDVPGARGATHPDAPRSAIEIDEQLGSACGGGGCTIGLRFRTIEGSMPERGVHYFANERGNQVGCDAAALPEPGASTIVEVAPAISREAIGCGFGGYDGTSQRYWVIVRARARALR